MVDQVIKRLTASWPSKFSYDKDNPNVEHTCENINFDVDNDWCQGHKDVWMDPKDTGKTYIESLHKNFPRSIASKYVKAVG